MLGHLRLKAFDKFRSDLELSLKSGKGFAASTRDCIQSSMLEFDTGLKGRYPFLWACFVKIYKKILENANAVLFTCTACKRCCQFRT